MTYRIDTASHLMQPAGGETMRHGATVQPNSEQLPSRHHPMLPFCQFRYRHIASPAKPSQSIDFML